MPKVPPTTQARLDFDGDRFEEVARLVSYEVGNTLLMMNLEVQRHFGLRAEEYQVFMLIVLSTVQRFARDGESDSAFHGSAPLSADLSGAISRRRISETLEIPLETVRRIVGRLLARGMIVERRRGSLSTSGGTLAALGKDAVPERVARRFGSNANAMIGLGVLALRSGDDHVQRTAEEATADLSPGTGDTVPDPPVGRSPVRRISTARS